MQQLVDELGPASFDGGSAVLTFEVIAVFENRVTGGLGTATWDLHGYIVEGELPPPPEPNVEVRAHEPSHRSLYGAGSG